MNKIFLTSKEEFNQHKAEMNEALQNAGAWKKIADLQLLSPSGYVSITNIPSIYTKFKLLIDSKSPSHAITYVRLSVNDRSDTHYTRIIEADENANVAGFTSSSSYGAEIGLDANFTSTIEFSYTPDLVSRGTFKSAVSRGTASSNIEYTTGAFQAQTQPVDAIAIRSSNANCPFSAGSKFVLLALA